MEQRFKFDHHTAIYHGGGRYTLTADEGYLLQTTVGGEPVKQAETKDYTQWHTIEAPATADEKPKRKAGKPKAAK